MNIWQAVIEALESLTSNKLRSGLTILGIVIGVGAVIAMLAIGTGAQNSITGEIQGIGSNLIFVFRGGSEDVRNPKPLTLGDADALADPFAAPSISGVAPILQGNGEVTFAGESMSTQLSGVTPAYEYVRNYSVSEGEFINDSHMLERAAVAIVGVEVADELFGRTVAVTGETIRIEGQPFRVIGVLEEKGGSAFGSEDNQIIVPLPPHKPVCYGAHQQIVSMSFSSRPSVPMRYQKQVRKSRKFYEPAIERKLVKMISRFSASKISWM